MTGVSQPRVGLELGLSQVSGLSPQDPVPHSQGLALTGTCGLAVWSSQSGLCWGEPRFLFSSECCSSSDGSGGPGFSLSSQFVSCNVVYSPCLSLCVRSGKKPEGEVANPFLACFWLFEIPSPRDCPDPGSAAEAISSLSPSKLIPVSEQAHQSGFVAPERT